MRFIVRNVNQNYISDDYGSQKENKHESVDRSGSVSEHARKVERRSNQKIPKP